MAADGTMKLAVGGYEFMLSTGAASDDEVAPIFSDEWLGSELWPAAEALISHLQEISAGSQSLTAQRVVELGAGSGACGLAAACLGAKHVILTDKRSLLPLLRINATAAGAALSKHAQIEVHSLEWSEDPMPVSTFGEVDLVLMSDCLNPVYGTGHATALAATLGKLLRNSANTCCGERPMPLGLLAQTRRGQCVAEAEFFSSTSRFGMMTRAIGELTIRGKTVLLHEISLSSSADHQARPEAASRASEAPSWLDPDAWSWDRDEVNLVAALLDGCSLGAFACTAKAVAENLRSRDTLRYLSELRGIHCACPPTPITSVTPPHPLTRLTICPHCAWCS